MSSDGLQGGGETVEVVGEGGLLFRGERREPETTADDEMGLTPEHAPSPMTAHDTASVEALSSG